MRDRIGRALLLFGGYLPTAIKEILKDVGGEIDQLKVEMQETRSKLQQLEGKQNASMVNSESQTRG